MGMFDNITCKYNLPIEGLKISKEFVYQTKDTPVQFLDSYEIREDGTLWHKDYDIENRSQATLWKKENPGKKLPKRLRGFGEMVGCMTRVNERWVRLAIFTGEIRFYSPYSIDSSGLVVENIDFDERCGWLEFSAYFYNGILKEIRLIEHTPCRTKTTKAKKKRSK